MLPGLATPHTRKSFHSARSPESSGARLSIEKIISSPDDFQLSEEGLWLLPTAVAERDVEQDTRHAYWLADKLEAQGTAEAWVLRFRRMGRLLSRSRVTQEGCVQGGLRGAQVPAAVVIRLAEFEMGSGTHTTPDEVPHISLCGNGDCYNTRHHNLDFGASRRDLQRVELNPSWYRTLQDDSIATLWGDVLPPVHESLSHFVAFQRLNFPYVPLGESPLTAGPISQLAFHPLTGCWEAYMYERSTPGLMNMKNGYGVMYGREEQEYIDPDTGLKRKGYRRGSRLAHNLVWAATGRNVALDMERNHMCNYPRCCNPLHLEEISPEENKKHGQYARMMIRRQELLEPERKNAGLSPAEVRALYIPLRDVYREITTEAGL